MSRISIISALSIEIRLEKFSIACTVLPVNLKKRTATAVKENC
jgi:hypothetical protein